MKQASDEVKKYLDEQYAFDALQSAVRNAVDRDLTETEIRYIKWLTKYDCETIDTFVELFKAAGNCNKSVNIGENRLQK